MAGIFRSTFARTILVLLGVCGAASCRRHSRRLARCSLRQAGKGRLRRCQHCHGDAILAASTARVCEFGLRPAQIQRALYSPKAHGIYASDMERYFREKGFRTFTIRGEWEDLKQHLDKGRPLIVALKPRGWRASSLCGRDRRGSGAGNRHGQRSGATQTAQAGPVQLRSGMERGRQMDAPGSCLKPNLANLDRVLYFFFCL